MDELEIIIKQNFINSYSQNIQIKNNLKNVFKTYYSQNIKYHILWLFLHSFSFSYPLKPSEECMLETVNFIYNIIPKNLTSCSVCQNDYNKYIEHFNIFTVVSSRNNISNFFIDLHNHITKKKIDSITKSVYEINKFNINNLSEFNNYNIYDYDYIKQIYTNTDYVSLLENKFNINMFKLIENKMLSSFFIEFNKINIENINIDFNINLQIT